MNPKLQKNMRGLLSGYLTLKTRLYTVKFIWRYVFPIVAERKDYDALRK